MRFMFLDLATWPQWHNSILAFSARPSWNISIVSCYLHVAVPDASAGSHTSRCSLGNEPVGFSKVLEDVAGAVQLIVIRALRLRKTHKSGSCLELGSASLVELREAVFLKAHFTFFRCMDCGCSIGSADLSWAVNFLEHYYILLSSALAQPWCGWSDCFASFCSWVLRTW